jgi:hypothetical protein
MGSMSATAMRELIEAGAARPLLTGFEVTPTSYDGAWWYVPSGAGSDADYLLAGPDLSAELDRLRARSDRIDGLPAEPGEPR